MAYAITLQTSDSGINPGDKLGILSYAASNESSGSDAISIAASIHAEAETEFTSSSNKTSLVFSTSADGTNDLDPKLKITSSGHFLPTVDNVRDLGQSDLRFRNIYVNSGLFDNLFVNNIPVAISGQIYVGNKGFINIIDDITTYALISGGYTVGTLDIFLNGVKLIYGDDFTATDGSGVLFNTAPESGSIVEYLSLYPSASSFSHPSINAASSVDNSNNTFIQDLLLDQYGHVTGVVSVAATGVSATSETDPIFTGSIAYTITSGDISNWNTAYSWGDHSNIGYSTTGALYSVSGYLQNQIDNLPADTNTFVTGINYNSSQKKLVLFRNDGASLTGNFSAVVHSGDNISVFNNDVGYITTDIYLTGVSFNNSTRDLTFSWNSGINDISVNIPAGTGITAPTGHIAIDAASSSDNSGRTYIQDILLDQYGHVTGISTATETAVGSGVGVLDPSGIYDILVAGTGISIAYSTGNNNITISNTGPTIGLVYFLN